MRALENLTPGGSEYVGDIKRCVEFIRWRQSSQHQRTLSLAKRITLLTKQIHAFEERDLLAWELAEAVIKTVPGPDRKGDPVPMLVKKACQLLRLYQGMKS